MSETTDEWSEAGGYGDEIGLIDLLRVLWQRKVLIVAGATSFAIVAFLLTNMMPLLYEADITLLVTRPKFQAESGTALPTTIPNLTALVSNRGVVARVLEEGQLTGLTPQEFIDQALTVEAIRNTTMLRIAVRLPDPEAAAAAVTRLGDRAIELNTQLNQAETATSRDFIKEQLDQAQVRRDELREATLAFQREARLETLTVERQSLLTELGTLELAQLEAQRGLDSQSADDVAGRLSAAQDEHLDFGRTEQFPRARLLLEIKLGEKALLENEVIQFSGEIEALRARVAEAELLIAEQPRLLEVESAIAATPALEEGAAEAEPRAQISLRQDLISPFLNPTHQVLEQELVATKTRLAAQITWLSELRKKLDENAVELEQIQAEVAEKRAREVDLEQAVDLARGEYLRLFETSPEGYRASLTVMADARQRTMERLRKVQSALYASELEIAHLELESDLAAGIYSDLKSQYEQARIQVGSRSAQLQVIDSAFVPNRPVSPRKLRDVLLAFLAGALFSTLLAFSLEYVRFDDSAPVPD
jgi:uncharacterized protein involved in exopolysaccharide biosynthesis